MPTRNVSNVQEHIEYQGIQTRSVSNQQLHVEYQGLQRRSVSNFLIMIEYDPTPLPVSNIFGPEVQVI